MKSLVLSAAMLLASSGAFACSNFIVGKKASVDGSVMVSYNADDYGIAPTSKNGIGQAILSTFNTIENQKKSIP